MARALKQRAEPLSDDTEEGRNQLYEKKLSELRDRQQAECRTLLETHVYQQRRLWDTYHKSLVATTTPDSGKANDSVQPGQQSAFKTSTTPSSTLPIVAQAPIAKPDPSIKRTPEVINLVSDDEEETTLLPTIEQTRIVGSRGRPQLSSKQHSLITTINPASLDNTASRTQTGEPTSSITLNSIPPPRPGLIRPGKAADNEATTKVDAATPNRKFHLQAPAYSLASTGQLALSPRGRRSIPPDVPTQIPFQVFREQQINRSKIMKSPVTIARSPSLLALEKEKQGGFDKLSLHDGGAHKRCPNLSKTFPTPNRDVAMEDTPSEEKKSLIVRLKCRRIQSSMAGKVEGKLSTRSQLSSQEVFPELVSRAAKDPFSTPALSTVTTPTSVSSRKRKKIFDLSDEDSDYQPPSSPKLNPNATVPNYPRIAKKPQKTKTSANRLARHPSVPRTPPSQIQTKTPPTPGAPSRKRARAQRPVPNLPSAAKADVHSSFRSSRVTLQGKRAARRSAENRISHIAKCDAISQDNYFAKLGILAEGSDDEMEHIGGRLRSLSMTPSVPMKQGEDAGGEVEEHVFQQWVKERGSGDRYLAKSVDGFEDENENGAEPSLSEFREVNGIIVRKRKKPSKNA